MSKNSYLLLVNAATERDERTGLVTHEEQEPAASSRSVRRIFWASAAFYVLIAFEFFYMASPFATYFYAVYGPGLDWLQNIGVAEWMLWFFLPHLVEETRSVVIDHAETVGLVLFFGGLLVFAVGAFQVYLAKIRKTGAVEGGLYRTIRHPQYTALILASLGMLLIWPRFLVLFSTIAVIFAYILLARAEESLCLRQFPGYRKYSRRTGMFFPRRWWPLPRLTVPNRWVRTALWLGALIVVVSLATSAAFGLRTLTIASLYTHKTQEGLYLSVVRMSEEDLQRTATIARNAPGAAQVLDRLGETKALLAYVLPTNMYVSEIPMHVPPGETFGHSVPRDRDPERYKVIFTEATFGAQALPDGASILAYAVNKRPVIEIHIDLGSNRADEIYPPPAHTYYDGHQVPVF
ncbi:MAG: isoprenylcysteine carboxylmethyltransferase family protein [Devosia sp.]